MVKLSGTLSKRDKIVAVSIAIKLFLDRKLIVLKKCLNESLNLSRATSNPQNAIKSIVFWLRKDNNSISNWETERADVQLGSFENYSGLARRALSWEYAAGESLDGWRQIQLTSCAEVEITC